MTTRSMKALTFGAAALLLTAVAAPTNAQMLHGGGGGGGGHGGGGGGGGGGAHFGGGGGGGMLRGGGGGGGHFSAPRASSGSRGMLHVQRSGGAHAHNRAAVNAHSRKAAQHEHRVSHRQAVHERNRVAHQNRAHARRDAAAARANAHQNRQTRNTLLRQAHQGRFAGRIHRVPGHVAYRPYRWAWRHGWYAGFVPWYGALWWPYAYADIFAFTFWPWGYDPGYWYYAYDDFFDGVYYGDLGTGPAYASAGRAPLRTASVSGQQVAQLCKQPNEGLTAWPTAEINSKLNLTSEQKALFDDLQAAGKKAADIFAESCPRDQNLAVTPTGRLEAMTVRLDATLRSVETVKPALDKFYASLSDEQKEQFNEIGPKNKSMLASRKRTETQGSAAGQEANGCKDPKPGLTSLPIQQIQDSVHPSEAQQANLKELGDATNQAVSILQNACPEDAPMTPPGRLDAMETRLKAMIEAANTIKPSLDRFYGSLNNEQKARFNKLDRKLASND